MKAVPEHPPSDSEGKAFFMSAASPPAELGSRAALLPECCTKAGFEDSFSPSKAGIDGSLLPESAVLMSKALPYDLL